MSDFKVHKGVVTDVVENVAVVVVERQSACANCENKSSCFKDDFNDMLVKIPIEDVSIGDEVAVSISSRAFYQSIFYAYVMPIIVGLVTAFTLSALLDPAKDEIYIALTTLLSIAVYFATLRYLPISKNIKVMGKKWQKNGHTDIVLSESD